MIPFPSSGRAGPWLATNRTTFGRDGSNDSTDPAVTIFPAPGAYSYSGPFPARNARGTDCGRPPSSTVNWSYPASSRRPLYTSNQESPGSNTLTRSSTTAVSVIANLVSPNREPKSARTYVTGFVPAGTTRGSVRTRFLYLHDLSARSRRRRTTTPSSVASGIVGTNTPKWERTHVPSAAANSVHSRYLRVISSTDTKPARVSSARRRTSATAVVVSAGESGGRYDHVTDPDSVGIVSPVGVSVASSTSTPCRTFAPPDRSNVSLTNLSVR